MTQSAQRAPETDESPITLFLSGDVMTGRGIDQILPRPGDPTLHERAVSDARTYVDIAEQHSGRLPRERGFDYVWGAALDELTRVSPDLRIINLETAVTTSNDYWKGKSVHYRMNPRNIPCLTAAEIDCCILANNHVLDWGYAGLEETLEVLDKAGIQTAGAGSNLTEAQRPAVFDLSDRDRVLVFGVGAASSGIPAQWAAETNQPGIHLVDLSSSRAVAQIQQTIEQFSRPDDLVVVSIHWGSNWGYDIPRAQQRLAHGLIDRTSVNVIHGHSSHHVKGIEVFRNRPILYGCGDLLTDYEGIEGYEWFRDDLGLMYFVHLESGTGDLDHLNMSPTHLHQLQIERASARDVEWLVEVYNREYRSLDTKLEPADGDQLTINDR